jgi:hypothetical protein
MSGYRVTEIEEEREREETYKVKETGEGGQGTRQGIICSGRKR